jgi:hypothetical protein
VINLDRAQSFALHRAATDSVLAYGSSGTGKSCLANAIAVQAAGAGLTCLLVGSSSRLDKPLVYTVAGVCHPILARRAQVNNLVTDPRQHVDPLVARGRINPSALRGAMRIMRRARELLEQHNLGPEEVEHSLLAVRPVPQEALDLIVVISQDATRVADMLWTGNRRNGRSLHDVELVVAGRQANVPADEEPLALILADESHFERKLAAVLATATPANDEKQLRAVMSTLRSRPPTDKTLKEVHENVVWMRETLRDAIDLVSKSGNAQAALQIKAGTHTSKIIEHFVRKRPNADADATIKSLKDALRQFEKDGAALVPYLDRYGSRSIGSIAPPAQERTTALAPSPLSTTSFVQKIREARYAARQLPGWLGQLRALVSSTIADETAFAPIEEAAKRLESRVLDGRVKVANELRQLRDLFASTGFGDLFMAPAGLLDQHETLLYALKDFGPSHSPEILDLLIEATASGTSDQPPRLSEWLRSHVRVRSQSELVEIATRGDHFDVLVADDVDELDASLLEHFAATGTRVHRIGCTPRSDAIPLEIPHRQTNCEIADVVSERPGRWLTGPGGMGVVVRDFGHFDLDFLRAAAGRLVATLQEIGCGASLAPLPRDTITNVLVAVVDTLSNSALRSLATQAREGVVIFCRRDLRKPERPVGHAPSSDCITAQSLGWRIVHACTDGLLLEKDGRCVALIDEPVALTAADEVVTDMLDRLTALGWRPIVAWRDAPRDRSALNTLLNSHSMPISRDQTLHTLLERFALEPPPVAAAGDRESGHGDHPLGASGDLHLGVAVTDEALDVELFLAEPAEPAALSLVPTTAESRPSAALNAAHPAPESTQTVSRRDDTGPESPEVAPLAVASPVGHAVESPAPEPLKAAPAGHAAVPHSPEVHRTSAPATAGRELDRSDTPEAAWLERDRRPESTGEGHATPGETTIGSGVEPIDPAALDAGHEVEAAA